MEFFENRNKWHDFGVVLYPFFPLCTSFVGGISFDFWLCPRGVFDGRWLVCVPHIDFSVQGKLDRGQWKRTRKKRVGMCVQIFRVFHVALRRIFCRCHRRGLHWNLLCFLLVAAEWWGMGVSSCALWFEGNVVTVSGGGVVEKSLKARSWCFSKIGFQHLGKWNSCGSNLSFGTERSACCLEEDSKLVLVPRKQHNNNMNIIGKVRERGGSTNPQSQQLKDWFLVCVGHLFWPRFRSITPTTRRIAYNSQSWTVIESSLDAEWGSKLSKARLVLFVWHVDWFVCFRATKSRAGPTELECYNSDENGSRPLFSDISSLHKE